METNYKTKPKGVIQKVKSDYKHRQKVVLNISDECHKKLKAINSLIATKNNGSVLTFSGLIELFIEHYTDDMMVHIARGD